MRYADKLLNDLKACTNMIHIEGIYHGVIIYYLDKYTKQFASWGTNPGRVPANGEEWVKLAVTFYRVEIAEDKDKLFQAIPERFNRTTLYKKLAAEHRDTMLKYYRLEKEALMDGLIAISFEGMRSRNRVLFLLEREIARWDDPEAYEQNKAHWEGHELRM